MTKLKGLLSGSNISKIFWLLPFILARVLLAQNATTFSLTPIAPLIDRIDQFGQGTSSVTTGPGSLQISLSYSGAKGSFNIAVEPPPTISGKSFGAYIEATPPAVFKVTQSFTGLDSYTLVIGGYTTSSDCTFTKAGQSQCSIGPVPLNSDATVVYLPFAVQVHLTGRSIAEQPITGFFFFSLGNKDNNASIAIDHVEVVQAIQDRAGTAVPYIVGKKALIRVFVKSTGSDPVAGVTGSIRATASANSSVALNTIQLNNSGYTAYPSPQYDTGALASLNFLLFSPPADSVNLAVSVAAPNGDKVNATKTVVFTRPSTVPDAFYVAYLPICVTDQFNKPTCPESIDELDRMTQVLAEPAFPFPDGTINYFEIPVPKPPVFPGFVGSAYTPFPEFDLRLSKRIFKSFVLLNIYPLPGAPRIDHLTAWIPALFSDGIDHPFTFHWYEQLAQLAGLTSKISWQTSLGGIENITGAPFRLAHRLGHQMGLADHPDSVGQEGFDASKIGDSMFPGAFVTAPSYETFMDPKLGGNWISIVDYNGILSKQVPVQPAIAPPEDRAVSVMSQDPAAAASDYVVVSGTVQRDGSAGQIDPVYRVTTSKAQIPSQPAGNHCLQFSNAGGATLGQYCFDLNVGAAAGLDQQIFAVAAPWPAGTTQMKLMRSSKQLTSVTAAAQDPVVTILSPKSGDRWQGPNTISWSLAGASASNTVYTVLYSNDGGTSWLTMASDISETQYSLDTAQMLGGSQVYFRVIAASGLNSGTATVGPIQVTQAAKIGATPSSLDFGNVMPGKAMTRNITIASSGSGPLTISSISVDNPAFSLFAKSSSMPLTVGRTRTVTVLLQAPGSGRVNGTLTLKSNDPVTPVFSIPLTGQAFDAPTPSIDPSAASLDFGSVAVNQTADVVLSVGNSGSADLSIASIRSSDPQFTVVGPGAPFTVSVATTTSVTLRFKPTGTGTRSATITIASNDPTHGNITVAASGTGVGANSSPQISAGGVVNAASFQGTVARGALATVFGSNLANGIASADRLPLPTILAGAQVSVGGIPAPLVYVSPTQINFQVPFEAPISGSSSVVVTRDGSPSGGQAVQMAEYAPGVFAYARTATTLDPVIVHVDNKLVTPDNPALPNEILIIYATGVGSFDHPPATGAASPSLPVAAAKVLPTVTVGGAQAQVQFAGLTPGFVGLVQINIKLPAVLPAGNSLPLLVQFGSASSQALNLSVAGKSTGPSDVVLKVDGGVFDFSVGYPNGGASAYFVNRLTPPSYPATLKSVQIYFSNRSDGLALNAPLTVISATNPSGSSAISTSSAGAIDLTAGKVTALDQFNSYTVPARTITSGDFVVGFLVANPADVYPAELDQGTPSQKRSYTSTNGLQFSLLDSVSASVAGNLGIRAIVTLGGTTNTP